MSKTRALRNWRGLASSGKIKLGILGLFFLFSVPFVGAAQELVIHTQELVQAEVVSVVDTGSKKSQEQKSLQNFKHLKSAFWKVSLRGALCLLRMIISF